MSYLQEQKLSGLVSPTHKLLLLITQALNFSSHWNIPSISLTSSTLISSSSFHGPSASLPGVGRVPHKKLTPAEMQQKHELNLCYQCDEKWHKNHCCTSTPHLLLLLSEDNVVELPLPKVEKVVEKSTPCTEEAPVSVTSPNPAYTPPPFVR